MDESAPRPGLRRARLVVLLYGLLLVGLPLGVMVALMGERAELPVTTGDQPGGALRGRVVLADGAPAAGERVELLLAPLEGPPVAAGAVACDALGRFAFEAPAHRGSYLLRAGGGLWQKTLRAASMLDPRGEVVDPGELELRLAPGCRLTVELTRAGERQPPRGEWSLRARLTEGRGPFGLLARELSAEGEFEGGVLVIDGLPPLRGALELFLAGGDSLRLELDLEPGDHVRRFDL